MSYLFNQGYGANANTIMNRANIPSQDFTRFRGFLEDLCIKGFLHKIEEETGGDQTRVNYVITEKGKVTVGKYRESHLTELFGSVEDYFKPPEF
jgi:predicted transcriptional regulator